MTGSTPTLDLHLTDRPRRASAGFGVAPAEGSRHGVAVASVERLGKRYGRRQAVDGVSFEVNEREVVGLLGPNGSGKTTILRVLTGYLRPSEGTVRIDGFDVVRDGHQARARVGYVPENAPLYGHMRVDEFLHFMGRLRGLRGPALRRGVESARARLALEPVGDAVIGRLSRGYRQRVSIAQAVLHEPKLLVLDEPTNGLDPRQVIELRGLLRTLAHDSAVLVTSHILAEMRTGRRPGRDPARRAAARRPPPRRPRARRLAPGPRPGGSGGRGRGGLVRPAGDRRRDPGGAGGDPGRLAGGGGGGRRSDARRRRPVPCRHRQRRDGRGGVRPGGAVPPANGEPSAPVTAFLALVAKELRALFVSPIAYAVIAVFLVLNGYGFAVTLFATKQATLVNVFFQAAVQLVLFVPLVTMRQFAEERRGGTLELLLTAPVREGDIVLAKFAASMGMLLAMVALTLVYAGILARFSTPDWGPIYSGYLGLVLLAGALVSIGLAVSALTANQIVAAVVSLGVFGMLWAIDAWAALLPSPIDDWVLGLSLLARFRPSPSAPCTPRISASSSP